MDGPVSKDDHSVKAKEEKDLVSRTVGDFGKWQLRISIMMALLKLPTAWYQLNIIFLAPPQEFWCQKPDVMTKYTDSEWRKMCKPMIEEDPCLIFDPYILASFPKIDTQYVPLVKCEKFEYDLSTFNKTIQSEWDLVCSKHWYIHLSQCILMWGILVGSLLFGALADTYGRRIPLMIAIVLQCVGGYVSSTIPWLWAFILNRFILALASGGTSVISFVMCMEVVSGKWRTTMPVVSQLPFSLGSTLMAVLAYWLRDWRKLEFALATLSGLFIFYWFYLPESPRWLLAKGQTSRALEILKDAAHTNKINFNDEDTRRLISKPNTKKNPGLVVFLRSHNMRLKTILLSINWFCTGLSFYTFSQYLGSIGDNIFVTVAVSGFISMPGALACVFIISRFGRRKVIGGFQCLTGCCFICIMLIPRDVFVNDWPRLVCAGIGLGGMAGSVSAIYLYSGELYPTLGRNVGIGFVSMFARIGSMVAPFLVSLDNIVPNLPLMLLAAVSFAQITLVFPLPETKDRLLPDTIEQAEQI